MTTEKNRMKKTTLRNSFHNTEVTVLIPWSVCDESQDDVYQYLTDEAEREKWTNLENKARQRLSRVNRALCGMSDCCCGTVL